VNYETYAVKAVGVTLAVLDEQTQARLSNRLANMAMDSVWTIPLKGTLLNGGSSIKGVWERNLQNGGGFYQRYPVGGNLKILERYIPLTSSPVPL